MAGAQKLNADSGKNALQQGLAALSDLLARSGFRAAGGTVNELPDAPIEERGA